MTATDFCHYCPSSLPSLTSSAPSLGRAPPTSKPHQCGRWPGPKKAPSPLYAVAWVDSPVVACDPRLDTGHKDMVVSHFPSKGPQSCLGPCLPCPTQDTHVQWGGANPCGAIEPEGEGFLMLQWEPWNLSHPNAILHQCAKSLLHLKCIRLQQVCHKEPALTTW